jgi:hypothetical protein
VCATTVNVAVAENLELEPVTNVLFLDSAKSPLPSVLPNNGECSSRRKRGAQLGACVGFAAIRHELPDFTEDRGGYILHSRLGG